MGSEKVSQLFWNQSCKYLLLPCMSTTMFTMGVIMSHIIKHTDKNTVYSVTVCCVVFLWL